MKLIQCNTYKRKVRVDYPHPEDADRTVRVEFEAEFRFLSTEELQRLPKTLSDSEDKALLDLVLVGIHKVEDERGEPIAPSAAATIIKSDPWYTKATVASWQASFTGAREKN